jgi:hypothetical protein
MQPRNPVFAFRFPPTTPFNLFRIRPFDGSVPPMTRVNSFLLDGLSSGKLPLYVRF